MSNTCSPARYRQPAVQALPNLFNPIERAENKLIARTENIAATAINGTEEGVADSAVNGFNILAGPGLTIPAENRPSPQSPAPEAKPPVRLSATPNLENLSHSSAKVEADLNENVKIEGSFAPLDPERSTFTAEAKREGAKGSVTLNPLYPERSTFTVEASKEEAKGSITLNPMHPNQPLFKASYREGDISGGLRLPLSNPKQTRVLLKAKINKEWELGGDINLHKPHKSDLQASVIIPVAGVPLKVSVKTRLTQPENAQITVGIPTFGLDKLIPGVPETIMLPTIDMRKIRRRLRDIGNKAAKTMGLGKNLFGRNKDKLKRAMEKQKALETFLSLHKSQNHLQALASYTPPSLLEDLTIYRSIVELNDALGETIQAFANFPAVEAADFHPEPLSPILDELIDLLEQASLLAQGQTEINDSFQAILDAIRAQTEQIDGCLDSIEATIAEAERNVAVLADEHQTMSQLAETVEECASNANVLDLLGTIDQAVLDELQQMLQDNP